MENNILSLLTKDQKSFICVTNVKKGDIIFREGDLCTSISVVVSGEVKISSFTFEGNELVYNIIKNNEIFGNNLIFSDEPYYKGDVICIKSGSIVNIDKNNLVTLLQINESFLLKYLGIQANFGKKLNSTIKMISYTSAEERFKYYLFINNNKIVFHSISELSNILHLQRETLSRLINRLEKENIITRSHHTIILN